MTPHTLTNIHYAQVVTEYERAVLFRLGRLQHGGAKGPGERVFHTKVLIKSFSSLLICVSAHTP